MTIEQLAETATDEESFSRDGDVVVELQDGTIVPVPGAIYDAEKKLLVLTLGGNEPLEPRA